MIFFMMLIFSYPLISIRKSSIHKEDYMVPLLQQLMDQQHVKAVKDVSRINNVIADLTVPHLKTFM